MKKTVYTILAILFAFNSNAQNLSQGLQAYYPFNGNFNDYSGNNNNGTQHGGVLFGTNKTGNTSGAAYFDGVDDFIEVAPSLTITPTDSLSICFTFKTNKTTGQYLISKHDYFNSVNNYQFNAGFNLSTLPSLGLFFGSDHNGDCNSIGSFPNASDATITGQTIMANVWYTVVMTFSSGVKSIYVDGSLLMQQNVSSSAAFPHSIDSCANGKLIFGSHWSQDPLFFNGFLDEVRIYKRVLTNQEVNAYTTLINDIKETNQTQISISPNPTSDVITIKGINQPTVAVFNLMGQKVVTSQNSNEVNLANLPAGMYMVQVLNKDMELVKSEKVIKE